MRAAWRKEVVRSIYDHHDPALASSSSPDSAGTSKTSRVRLRSASSAAPWSMASPDRRLAPGSRVERAHRGLNNLIRRVKRVAFGTARFRNFRIRALLYAGHPNWELLATITPR